jgi:hypothetical protein
MKALEVELFVGEKVLHLITLQSFSRQSSRILASLQGLAQTKIDRELNP